MYWDIKKCLSYSALFNFIIGNRGGGKTYGSKKYVIERFKKTGEQFIYLRRYKQEFKRKNEFFKAICSEFPNDKFEIKGNTILINDETAGFFVPLSTSKIEKSSEYPSVTTIIFDEFIIDKGTYRYLADEVICFLEFYETVARTRNNVKVFFLSNAITISNPYFLYFNLSLPYQAKIKCKNDVLIELVANKDFINYKKNTRFGKLISGTEYSDYAIENKFLRDNTNFIEKKSGICDYYFGIRFKGENYGVWVNWEKGKMWLSSDFTEERIKFSLTLDDFTENTLLISGIKKSLLFKNFINAFKNGCLFYETQKIKNASNEIYKILVGRT